jgi:hypothetical protein
VEDDWHSVLENSPMSCYFATREEELFKIGAVSFKRFAIPSIKVSKVGLGMLFLLRSDPLLLEFPPFMLDMLEVTDSPAESPKCIRTQNEKESEAPTRNRANRTIRFGKPNGLILSTPTAVKGTVGSGDGVLLLAKCI